MAWESLLSGLRRHDNASYSPRNVSPSTLRCCHRCTGTPTSSSFTSSNDSGRVSSSSSLPSASPPHPTRSPAPPAWSTHLTFTVSYSDSVPSCSYLLELHRSVRCRRVSHASLHVYRSMDRRLCIYTGFCTVFFDRL